MHRQGVTERAYKYQGLGNDFLVLDRRRSSVDIDAARARWLCDRRRGVGADGVVVLCPSEQASARMIVHNADGSVAEMCGNALRCAVKYLADRSGEQSGRMRVDTDAGLLDCSMTYAGGEVSEVEVAMSPARLVAESLPSGRSGKPFVHEPLPGFDVKGTAVEMGPPHLVLFDTPLDLVCSLGPQLEGHPLFPRRTNVDFARIEHDGIAVTVWERGCGLTLACGTGGCATVAAAVYEKRVAPDSWVWITFPGGRLQVRVSEDLARVDMRGPATFVFEADIPSPPA
jgi:diaminopimelate epimerase